MVTDSKGVKGNHLVTLQTRSFSGKVDTDKLPLLDDVVVLMTTVVVVEHCKSDNFHFLLVSSIIFFIFLRYVTLIHTHTHKHNLHISITAT